MMEEESLLANLIQSSGLWTLAGIIIGFILAEGGRYIRYRWRIRRLKRMIKEELRSILYQIQQKEDIVRQIISKLKIKEILHGESVGIINIGYRHYAAEIYEHLGVLERNCLHNIHERLDVADKMLRCFKSDILNLIKDKVLDKPYEAYEKHFSDILESYGLVKKLINSYLNGDPIDVCYLRDKIPPIVDATGIIKGGTMNNRETRNDVDAEEKQKAFYSCALSAWLSTRMERDKSILALSSGAIGLLITLLINFGTKGIWQNISYLGAFASFLACIIISLLVFNRNATYLERVIKEGAKRDKCLRVFDRIIFDAFISGVIFAIFIAIISCSGV